MGIRKAKRSPYEIYHHAGQGSICAMTYRPDRQTLVVVVSNAGVKRGRTAQLIEISLDRSAKANAFPKRSRVLSKALVKGLDAIQSVAYDTFTNCYIVLTNKTVTIGYTAFQEDDSKMEQPNNNVFVP